MSKKIITVSIAVLLMAVALTACKGKEPSAEKTTDKVVSSVVVTGENGTTVVEIYEDKDGDRYITNVSGEKVPLTVDNEGFGDEIGYLVTSKTNESSTNTTASTTEPASSNEPSESESTGGIIIAPPDQTKQDSIRYEDLVNAKNNS